MREHQDTYAPVALRCERFGAAMRAHTRTTVTVQPACATTCELTLPR
jgi:hypothetical protein